MPFNTTALTFASVATKPSIVAMSGRIMPAPLAIPVTVALPLLKETLVEKAFATVSVVMIASAAEAQSQGSVIASPATILSAGSGSMITPVEKGRTWVGLHFIYEATEVQTAKALFKPSFPVPALALPVLTTRARTLFFRCFLAITTGAAQKRFCVNT